MQAQHNVRRANHSRDSRPTFSEPSNDATIAPFFQTDRRKYLLTEKEYIPLHHAHSLHIKVTHEDRNSVSISNRFNYKLRKLEV